MGNKKVLLLGGNGYIGSVLYDYLRNNDYDVTNVDLCWFGKVHEPTIECDYDRLSEDFIREHPHIILLAGHSAVSMCSDFKETFDNNVSKFVNLLSKTVPTQTVIYASTLAVYGNNDEVVDENYPLKNPINAYDYSKMARDQIANLFDVNTVGLRFGTVGGYSPNYRRENLMNSISIDAITKRHITISNPDLYRSLLGIDDLCRAIEVILRNKITGHKIYNLSSVNKKIIEFGKTIQTLVNCDLTINDSMKTGYSFRSTSKLFESDFNFKFNNSIRTIFEKIQKNHQYIKYSITRNSIEYVQKNV